MKNCNNCDHKEVCWESNEYLEQNSCDNWQGWRLTSEELPNNTDDVVILYKYADGDRELAVAYYYEGKWEDKGINYIFSNDRVIAWRPMPTEMENK